MKAQLLDSGEGRVLEVVTAGEPSERAFVFHHGGFGCSEGMAPLYRAAADSDVFLIGITRGGYAGSNHHLPHAVVERIGNINVRVVCANTRGAVELCQHTCRIDKAGCAASRQRNRGPA